MRQRHRGKMPAGRPAGYDDAVIVRAERRQLPGKVIDAGVDLRDDLVERGVRRQRVADQRDIDAMRHRTLGEEREDFLGPVLPIATMDEQQRRRILSRFQKVDPVALARAITEIEMGRIPPAHVARTLLPACDHLHASRNRDAVVKAEITIFLAQFAPVGCIEGRRHLNSPSSTAAFPLCRKMF